MKPKTLFRAGLSVVALSLFLLGYATAELSGGIGEVPNHWWSTLPVLGIGIGLGLSWFARSRPGTLD